MALLLKVLVMPYSFPISYFAVLFYDLSKELFIVFQGFGGTQS